MDGSAINSVDFAPANGTPLDHGVMERLFLGARTHNQWQDTPVTKETLEHLHGLLRWAPTSMNCSPARFVFVTSVESKEKLKPALMKSNQDKSMAAPVTVIIATDEHFHERMGELWSAYDAKPMFEQNEALRLSTAQRNGTLQGAYLILAARALGLDCGPMSGFDQAMVDETFLAGTTWKSNFLCNLGYGVEDGLYPRGPRPSFESVCRIV